VYDPGADAWQAGTAMPTARQDAEAAEAEGRIFVIGGRDVDEWVRAVDVYFPTRDQNREKAWEARTELSTDFELGVVGTQSLGGFLISIAPSVHQSVSVLYYYPEQDNWIISDEIYSYDLRMYPASTHLQGYYYLLGGASENGELMASAIRYQGLYTITFPIITQ
jgi:hypothetical protein